MESKILIEEAHRLGGGADQVQDLPVQDTGGVQGGCAEHCAQRGDIPWGAQHDGGHRQADVQGLRQRPAGDDHLQGLLQICQHKVIFTQDIFPTATCEAREKGPTFLMF